MPELNPIVSTLLQLIDAKQQDAALAQRKNEADDQMAFNHEQLANTLEERRLERKRQEAEDAIQHAKLKIDFTRQAKADVQTGLTPLQGREGVQPSVPDWQSQMGQGQNRTIQLPNGQSIEVPMPTMDTSVSQPARSFLPYQDQIVDTPLGPQGIPSNQFVSYDEAQQRKFTQAQRDMGLDVLKAGLTSQVQEQAKGPNLRATNQARIDAAQVTATGAGERNQVTITANKEIQGMRDATAFAVARIRAASANTKLASNPIYEDTATKTALGQAKMPAGNAGMIVNSIHKKLGYVSFDPTRLDKVAGMQQLSNVLDRLGTEFIPLLADTKIGGLIENAKVNVGFPSDLSNKSAQMKLESVSIAKSKGLVGNPSDKDTGIAINTFADPKTTKVQGLDKIRVARQTISNELSTNALRGVNDKQAIDILTQPGMNNAIYLIYAKDSKGKFVTDENGYVPKYTQKEDGTWGVFNPVTNKYKRIE